MTKGEANALNVLVDWIMSPVPDSRYATRTPPTPTDSEALEALELLAGKAHKALYAGWSPERLRERWPERRLG